MGQRSKKARAQSERAKSANAIRWQKRQELKMQQLEARNAENGNASGSGDLDNQTADNLECHPVTEPVQMEPLTRLRPKNKINYLNYAKIDETPTATTAKCSSKRQKFSQCFICGVQRGNPKRPISRLSFMSTQARAIAITFTHLISGKHGQLDRGGLTAIFNKIENSYFCKSCGKELNNIYKSYEQLVYINKRLRSATRKVISQIKLNYERPRTAEDSADGDETQEQKLRQDVLNIAAGHEYDIETDLNFLSAYDVIENDEMETVNCNPEEVFLWCEDNSTQIKTEEGEDHDFYDNEPDFNSYEDDPLAFESIGKVESKGEMHNLKVRVIKNHPTVPKKVTQIQTLKEVFVCKLCDRVFTLKEEFKKHERNCRTKIPNKRCNICGLKGLTRNKLRHHIRIAHNDGNPKRGHCEVCGILAKDLKLHFAKSHQTDFTCSICDAHFNNYLDFNYHRTTHPELQLPPVKCEQCGKICVNNQLLKHHQSRIHGKKNPCICEVCGWGTRFEPQLLEHKRYYHEGIRDFICEICDATFSTNQKLKHHLKKHRGEIIRKHKCSYCSKTFVLIGKKQDHEAAVHGGELKYSCEHCGKQFPIKNYLYIHLRSHETPEQKEARRLKAKQNAEARRLSNKPVLIPKGRPRVKDVVGS